MNIIGMLDKAIKTLENGPVSLKDLTPGQVKQFGYASFIVSKSESIKKNMGKYANAATNSALADKSWQEATDTLVKAQAVQAYRSAERKLSAVKRLEAIAVKLA